MEGGLRPLCLLLTLCPLTSPCPLLCTCYQAPLTVSCQSRGLGRVPEPLPAAGARLFLQNNLIVELGPGSFPSNVSLLWLHSNSISRVRPGALRGLARLEELDLGDNPQLRALEPGTFAGLSRLRTLRLHRCGLALLPLGLFAGLRGLRYLYLQDNRIPGLRPGLFSDLSRLSHLFLHGNRLRRLQAGAFGGLRGLDRLLLHRNLIGLVQAGAFGGLRGLDTLFLSHNRLARLPGPALLPLPSLRFLRLDGNPWACDCRARGLRGWFGAYPGASSALTCSSPPGRKGRDLRLLTHRDFQTPAKATAATGLKGSPAQGSARPEYWPDYEDGDEALTSDPPGRCPGRSCSRSLAPGRLDVGIFPFPLWALTLLHWS
ncbi:reticulon-4 receptor-like 2 [Carcharodon carcharias]|uniref:reticulon-4 receptor-like 2 n=1 Tax=Carcharodon carcharias TaxID=13397 RepID=UPI001B7EE623|nr:reticulon-4 receptor-like 2 [Carcharodon carcharias]